MLILVRHGRTAANAAGLLLGRLDPPLDAEGERQARAVASVLGPVDLVVTSPLLRARQTAAHLAAPIRVDERWIELDYGSFDGKESAHVAVDVWQRWRSDLEFVPPGGESLAALARRVFEACEDLRAEAEARTVVVVSHVSPIKAAVAWALGTEPAIAWRAHLDQAAVTRISIGPYGPVLRSYNETWHLGTGQGAP